MTHKCIAVTDIVTASQEELEAEAQVKAQRERYADAGEELVAAAQALVDCLYSPPDSGLGLNETTHDLKAAIARTKL